MKTTLFLLFLLVLVLAAMVGDIVLRGSVQRRVAEEIQTGAPGVGRATVRFDDSFPFALPLLRGEVPETTIRLDDVETEFVTAETIVVHLEGLTFDRSGLVNNGRFFVRDVERATLDAVVTEDAIATRLGYPIELEPGRVRTSVLGVEVTADVELVGRNVVVDTGLANILLPVPDERYLPCDLDGQVLTDRIELHCVTTEIPAAIRDVLETTP